MAGTNAASAAGAPAAIDADDRVREVDAAALVGTSENCARSSSRHEQAPHHPRPAGSHTSSWRKGGAAGPTGPPGLLRDQARTDASTAQRSTAQHSAAQSRHQTRVRSTSAIGGTRSPSHAPGAGTDRGSRACISSRHRCRAGNGDHVRPPHAGPAIGRARTSAVQPGSERQRFEDGSRSRTVAPYRGRGEVTRADRLSSHGHGGAERVRWVA